MKYNIGIIGARKRNDIVDFYLVLKVFLKSSRRNDIIVSGGCSKGGDRFAEIIADNFGIKKIIYPPDKSKLGKTLLKINPKAAYAKINYDRNTLVANKSDKIIACISENRKGGTEDTINKFLKIKGLSENKAIKRKLLILV